MPPFKHFPKKPKRPHVLLTKETCDCGRSSDGKCPVCDWGLGVCAVCGGAESELVGTECPGVHRTVKPLWPCTKCEGMGRDRNNAKCRTCRGTGQQPEGGRA